MVKTVQTLCRLVQITTELSSEKAGTQCSYFSKTWRFGSAIVRREHTRMSHLNNSIGNTMDNANG